MCSWRVEDGQDSGAVGTRHRKFRWPRIPSPASRLLLYTHQSHNTDSGVSPDEIERVRPRLLTFAGSMPADALPCKDQSTDSAEIFLEAERTRGVPDTSHALSSRRDTSTASGGWPPFGA